MVVSCCAYGCTNRYGKAGTKFYRFPTEPDLKAKWVAAIKREKWEPTEYSRICSDHFITGIRSKSPNHPDYVPSVFVYSKSCNEDGLQRFHRSVARSISKFQTNLAPVAVEDDPGEHDMEDSEAEESDNEVEDDIDFYKGISDGVEEETFNDDIDDNSEFDNDNGNECNDNFEDSFEEGAAQSADYCEDYDDEVDGTNSSYVYNRISYIDLEDKEIEIGELQLEIEKLNDVIEKYEQENQLLREDNSLLKKENTRIKAILAQSQIANCSNVRAIISLKRNVDVMQSKLEENNFGASFITNNDRKTSFYTGLVSFQMFLTLFNLLKPLFTTKISTRPLIDEFFFTLFKLRLGVPYQDIAYRAGLSSDEVGKIFRRWIDVMSTELKPLVAWPDKEQLILNLPQVFRKHFSKVRCIIDCFEVFIQRPTSFVARVQTYSNYKKHNTVKVLIGIAPTGSICFISEAWGGRVSDKVVTQQSGILKLVEFGDQIMADRGFNVGDDLAMCGAELLIPAFTRGKKQLSTREVEFTRRLARVRIHVERVIGHLRKKYKILQQTLPITTIKHPDDTAKTNCLIDRILIVTAALTNLSESVVIKSK